ncbi:protein preY, mitochondrial-like [Babylonia areolata]|uniref:protein preY, mitochondrial-like n=1 Tax=Babylonia areolata TaxID=304850 RepID=UPI003FD4153B
MALKGTLLIRAGQLAALWTRAQQSYTLTAHNLCRTVAPASQTRQSSQDTTASQDNNTFNEKTLEHLVCPLSKKELRYDKDNNELVCDEIGVAYPIVNGIPNMVPQDARMLKNSTGSTERTES